MKLTIKLENGNSEIVARCEELDIQCVGSTDAQAIDRMKECIKFYMVAVENNENKTMEVLQ